MQAASARLRPLHAAAPDADVTVARNQPHVLEHHLGVPVPLRPGQGVGHRVDEPAFVMAAHAGIVERFHPTPDGPPRAAQMLLSTPVVNVQPTPGAATVADEVPASPVEPLPQGAA